MNDLPTRPPVLTSLASLAAYRRLPGKLLRWLHERRAARFEPARPGSAALDEHPAQRVQSDRLAVFLGDSRAAAWTPPNSAGWAFANRGINGESSTQTLGRFERQITPLKPAVVIIQTGVNDLWNNQASQLSRSEVSTQVRNNLHEIMLRCRQIHAQAVLATIFPLGRWTVFESWIDWQQVQDDISEINSELESLKEDGVHVLHSAAALCGADGFVQPRYSQDVLHLNAAGYQALDGALSQILVNMV